MAKKKKTPPASRFGFSLYHDRVLNRCVKEFGPCPFNCVKNGAPNCFYHVIKRECAPSQWEPV